MEFSELVKIRRSFRKYKDEEVLEQDIVEMVKTALQSPSWANSETERYYVYSYLSTYDIKPGYVKHYTVEELIEKGKRILNDAALDEATRSKYGL